MKLIMAIVSSKDIKELTKALMSGGFTVTKLGSAGGFLKSGVTTILCAVHNDRTESALTIIKETTHRRKYNLSARVIDNSALPSAFTDGMPAEIVVGGATVFVLPIEQFFKY